MREIFCHIDLWAAEAYLTALDAGEAGYLELLAKGVKIHNWLWDEMYKRFPKELDAAGFGYKNAKQFVHSLNYNVQPAKMAYESKLPLYVCEWVWAFYHTTFPNIKNRMVRVRNTLQSTHTLTSALGRQIFFFGQIDEGMLNDAYAWPSQSCIGEITNLALTKLYFWGMHGTPWIKPSLNTHDGGALRCYEEEKEAVVELVTECYNIPLTANGVTVVIPVELGFGNSFQEKKEKRIIRYE